MSRTPVSDSSWPTNASRESQRQLAGQHHARRTCSGNHDCVF